MDPKNKTAQLPAIRIEPEVFAKIEAEAAANFEKIADTVRRRITDSFSDPAAPVIRTAAQELRERRETLAVEALERAAAEERKELIHVDDARAVVEKDYAQMRQSLQSFAQTAALELGLDDLQREKLVGLAQGIMMDLSGEKPETFSDIADNK